MRGTAQIGRRFARKSGPAIKKRCITAQSGAGLEFRLPNFSLISPRHSRPLQMNPFSESQAQILIRCPQCGGDIGFLEESRAIRCEFCGTSLIVAGREGVLRYVLPARSAKPDRGPGVRPWSICGVWEGVCGARGDLSFLCSLLASAGAGLPLGLRVEAHEGGDGRRGAAAAGEDEGPSDPDHGPHPSGVRRSGFRDFHPWGFALRPFSFDRSTRSMKTKRILFSPRNPPGSRSKRKAERAANIFFEAEDLASEVALQSFVGRVFSVIYLPVWYVDCRHSPGARNRPHRRPRKENPLHPA